MGPAALKSAGAFPLPKTLAGTSIKVTVKGASVDAIMVYTVAGLVAALLPSITPVGDGTLTLTYNSQASDPAPIHVIKSSFGAFTINQGGNGPAVVTFPDYTPVTLLASAKPSDVLILWGTGLGPVSRDETQPSLGGDMRSSLHVQVYVGGKSAQVLYAGRSPGSTGLDQINLKLPAGVTGCFVPVAVVSGGLISNFTSVSISTNGNMCSDPVQPLSDTLQKVAAGKSVRLGLIQLNRFGAEFNLPLIGAATINEDTGTGYFYSLDQRTFLGSLGVAALNTFGSCAVWTCRGGTCVPSSQGAAAKLLDAGSTLTVSGPNGQQKLTKSTSGSYSAALGGGGIPGVGPPPYLDPGAYSVSAGGGSGANAVAAFTAHQSVVASPIQWSITSNAGTTDVPSISRSSDLSVKWSGGNPNGYVAIIGTSTTDTPQVTATFGCTEKVSVGHFTVPSWMLSAIPKSGQLSQSGITVSNGFLVLGSYPEFNAFTAPGLDLGFFSNLVLSGKNVQFQ